MKILIICLGFILLAFDSPAQYNPVNPSVPSANIAPTQLALQVSNDLYNGKLNISIPLYKYEFEGMSFPISMVYVGGNGIKPDEIPGIVGYGWSLQSGGYIHRKTRGKADECRDYKTTIQHYYCPTIPTDKATELLGDYSYFSNIAKLNNPNWASSSYATSLMPGMGTPSYSDYCNYYELYNTSPIYDLAPDEFTFSFGGISGKFYQDFTGNWISYSNDGKKYAVELNIGEQIITGSSNSLNYRSPRLIKGISLTSADGIKYTFGSMNPNVSYDKRFWEHSRMSQQFKGYLSMTPHDLTTYLDLVPDTWQLTKVSDCKTGSEIDLDYLQDGSAFYKSRNIYGAGNAIDNPQVFIMGNTYDTWSQPFQSAYQYPLTALSYIATVGWTPKNITFPNGVKIEFVTSHSNQLLSNEDIAFTSDQTGYFDTEDMLYGPGYTVFHQLDKIKVTNNGSLKKEIDFVYLNSPSNRLQLSSVKEISEANISSTYNFQYNNNSTATGKLPIHASTRTDHWGYYNNKDFFSDYIGPYSFQKLTNYSSYREPDELYGQAEILKKITYPTGGSVEFEYEANDYSKLSDKRTLAISSLSNNLKAGGVRIAKVKYYNNNILAGEKLFSYVRPGTNISSGFLAAPPPVYLDGTASYAWNFSSQGFSPSYYDGNNVSYTYAAESEQGNGSTEYEYTNYDNGFNDGLPVSSSASNYIDRYWFPVGYAKNSFKRGKVISIKKYSATSSLLEQSNFHYEHENSESNKPELRSLYFTAYPWQQYNAVSERIYSDNLISKEDITYALSNSYSQKVDYKYDQYGNLRQQTSYTSQGRRERTVYTYNYEYSPTATDEISSGITVLNNLGIKNQVLEKLTYLEDITGLNSKIISGYLFTYSSTQPFLKKIFKLQLNEPANVSTFLYSSVSTSGFLMDPRYLWDGNSNDFYDAKGHLLQMTDHGVKHSYLWGYANTTRVAEVAGAKVSDVAYTSFDDGNVSWGYSPSGVIGSQGSITGSKAYDLTFGLWKISLDPNINYVLSFWCKANIPGISTTLQGGATSNINPGNPKKILGDWNLFEVHIQGITGIGFFNWGNSGGTTYLDEVRLIPEKAQISSLTYEPLVGITSKCDQNNKIEYYEYDKLNRISLIKDENKNIIKKYCYNYYGQPELCGQGSTPVWVITGQKRCKPCPANAMFISGIQEHEEQNINPESSSTTQWVEDGPSLLCKVHSYWQTITVGDCLKDADGHNTGYVEVVQKDINPCSLTYTDERTITIHSAQCEAAPCGPGGGGHCANHTPGWACIKTMCEQGHKIYERSYTDSLGSHSYYHYEFSDGGWSDNYDARDTADWLTYAQADCLKDEQDNNTGFVSVLQRDINPSSKTFRLERLTTIYDTTLCSPPCNCAVRGEGWACIKEACEMGTKVYTEVIETEAGLRSKYHYEYSDGSWSQDYIRTPDADWVLSGNGDCLWDEAGNRTGFIEATQLDVNPASETFNRTRNITLYYPSLCPTNCDCFNLGEGWACKGTGCELGTKVYTGFVTGPDGSYCIYHYEYRDGSWSGDIHQSSIENCSN